MNKILFSGFEQVPKNPSSIIFNCPFGFLTKLIFPLLPLASKLCSEKARTLVTELGISKRIIEQIIRASLASKNWFFFCLLRS